MVALNKIRRNLDMANPATQNAPVKGLVVFVCDDLSQSEIMKLEPILLTETQYNNVLAGTATLTLTVASDENAIKSAQLTI